MATNFLLKRSGTASKRPEATSMALGELDINYDAATGGLFYKDSVGSVVKVGPAQVGSTAPNSSPAGSSGNSVGEFWYDTGASALKIWDGTVWVATGGGGGGGGVTSISGTAPITVNNTNPATPIIGVSTGSTTALGVVQLSTSVSSTSTTLAATASAVRLAYLAGCNAVAKSSYQVKGDILVAAALGLAGPLSVGTDGQVLTACSACGYGVTWAAGGGGGGGSGTVTSITAGTGLTGGTITTSGTIALDTACVIQPSLLTGKGSIIGASGSSIPVGVDGGADGLVLTACGACVSGLTWAAACVTPTPATPTVAGAVFGFTDLSDGNTALGQCALAGGNASAANVAIGKLALQNLTSNCSWNVAVGYAALNCATTAEFNTAVGGGALWCNTTGIGNTAIGSNTLFENNGSYNIAIGYNTAFSYAGCSSIFIGTSVVPDPGDCQLVISSGGNTWVRGYIDGAVKFGGGIVDYGGSCGTVGQVLTASGGNSYNWCDLPAAPTGATGTFTSQEGCTVTVTNGLITSIA